MKEKAWFLEPHVEGIDEGGRGGLLHGRKKGGKGGKWSSFPTGLGGGTIVELREWATARGCRNLQMMWGG